MEEQLSKKKKDILIRKGVKLSLFAEDMILHTENPKKFALKDYQS